MKHVCLNTLKARLLEELNGKPMAYAVNGNTFYYVEGGMDDKEKSCIYAIEPGDKKRRLVLKDYISSMSIFGETLYWTNPKTKEVNLRDLRCDKTRTYSDIYNDAEVIQEVDDERFVVFYESKCVNIFQNGHLRKLCTLPREFIWIDTVTYRDNFLYYYMDDGRICSIDIDTGKTATLYDLNNDDSIRKYDAKEWTTQAVSYSDQYIVLVLGNSEGVHMQTMVLNYQGDVLVVKRD